MSLPPPPAPTSSSDSLSTSSDNGILDKLTNPKVLIGAGGVLVGGAVIYYLWNRSSGKTERASSEPAAAATEESKPKKKSSKVAKTSSKKDKHISKDILLQVFDDITKSMEMVIIQLANIEQKLRQESASTQKPIKEEELLKYIMQQFEEAMKVVENQVYEKHKTTENDVQKASEHYAEDDDFKKAVAKLKRLYSVISGANPDPSLVAQVPDDLTIEKVLLILEETMEKMNCAMENTVESLKAADQYAQDDATQEKINQSYMSKITELRAAVHKKHEVNQEILHAAVLKYQSDPRFTTKMQELTHAQKERFAACGVVSIQ